MNVNVPIVTDQMVGYDVSSWIEDNSLLAKILILIPLFLLLFLIVIIVIINKRISNVKKDIEINSINNDDLKVNKELNQTITNQNNTPNQNQINIS